MVDGHLTAASIIPMCVKINYVYEHRIVVSMLMRNAGASKILVKDAIQCSTLIDVKDNLHKDVNDHIYHVQQSLCNFCKMEI